MNNTIVQKNQKIYLQYCEKVIPSLWKSLHVDQSVESILENEISLYHKIAKSPDCQSSLSRFYCLYEPLLLQAATNYLQTGKFSAYSNLFTTKNINLDAYSCVKSAIVFKGGYKLAHFDVLKSCIDSLSIAAKRKLTVIFLDIPASQQKNMSELLDIPNCFCLGSVNKTYKVRYHFCAHLLIKLTSLRSVTFWGIPFGMLFISKLIKKYYQNHALVVRYLTVKHKFSFSSAYVNRLVNGAPFLEGYDYVNQSQENLHPNFYSHESLKIKNIDGNLAVDKSTFHSLQLLNKIRTQDSSSIIIGIFARKEKLTPDLFSNLVQSLASLPRDIHNKIVLAICTNESDIRSLASFEDTRILNLHWGEFYFHYFNYINLFLDTYPFGGGLLLSQALVRGIPSLIFTKDISTNPSSIHAINSRGLPLVRQQNPECFKYISEYLLHDTEHSYWTAFKKIVCNSEIMHKTSIASRSLGESSFLPKSQSQGENLALRYLDLC